MISEGSPQLIQQYTDVLTGYEVVGTPENHDYVKGNQGWKIHLNVTPQKTPQVSEYLKSAGFHHKYINGVDIDDGKIFTIYIGSKELTEKIVKKVQDDIGDLLDEPKAKGDIQVSPKIRARFGLYHHKDYINRGYSDGIPLKKYYDEDDVPGSVELSKQMLQIEFGDYFGGGIKYYDPQKQSSHSP